MRTPDLPPRGQPLVTAVCHCEHCQRQTGSAFSIFVIVPRATLRVEGDARHAVTSGADTGERRQRQFCSKCGSPVVTLLAEQPELAVIKAGTLNDRSWLSPTLEVWCGSAQPWLAPIENSRRLARGCRPDSLLSSTATSGFWGLPRPICSVAVALDGQLEIAAPSRRNPRPELRRVPREPHRALQQLHANSAASRDR